MDWPGCKLKLNGCYAQAGITMLATAPLFLDFLSKCTQEDLDNMDNQKLANFLQKISNGFTDQPISIDELLQTTAQEDSSEFISKTINFLPLTLQILFEQYYVIDAFDFETIYDKFMNFTKKNTPKMNIIFIRAFAKKCDLNRKKKVIPPATININGINYQLHSVILHSGPNFSQGHYHSIVRVSSENFQIYDPCKKEVISYSDLIDICSKKTLTAVLYTNYNNPVFNPENFETSYIQPTQTECVSTESIRSNDFDESDSLSESNETDSSNKSTEFAAPDSVDLSNSSIRSTSKNLLEQSLKVGDVLPIDILESQIDRICKEENRFLYSERKKDYFLVQCHQKDCRGHVRGKIFSDLNEDDEKETFVKITSVVNHNCEPTGYKPNKLTKKEIKSIFMIQKSVKQSIMAFRTQREETHISNRTYYRWTQEKKLTSNAQILLTWKLIQDFVSRFSNKENSNTIYVENGNEVQYFFILPKESIIFLNSSQFIGLLILDATFMKHHASGRYFEICTYNPEHKILPLCFGFAPSENSLFVCQMLGLIKNNISNEEMIKTFICDESPGILKAINITFPNAKTIPCILHKSTHLSRKVNKILFLLLSISNKEEFESTLQQFVDEYYSDDDSKTAFAELARNYSDLYSSSLSHGIKASSAAETMNSLFKRASIQNPLIFSMICYEKFLIISKEVQFTNSLSNYVIAKQKEFENNKSIEIIEDIKQESFIFKQNNQLYTVRTQQCQDYKTFKCSCNKSTTNGYPCIHEVKAFLIKNSQEYKKEFHTSFTYESFNEFQQKIEDLPQTDFSNLAPNENITKCIEINQKKYPGKRKKCAIDYKEKKK